MELRKPVVAGESVPYVPMTAIYGGFGVLVAVLPLYLLVTGDRYWDARIVYGTIALAAIGIILTEIGKWRRDGAFSPLSWAMVGLLFFFSLTPVVAPERFYAYTDAAEYLPLVVIITLGMGSFVLGYHFSPCIRLHRLDSWLDGSVSVPKLWTGVVVVMGAYSALLFYLASALDISLYNFMTQNHYLLGGKERLFEAFGGHAYYLYLMFWEFPIGIATPATLCLMKPGISGLKRIVIVCGLGVMLIVTISSARRGILCYVLGGITILYALYSADARRRKRWTLVGVAGMFGVIIALVVLQIGVRSAGGTAVQMIKILDIRRAIGETFVHEAVDQNISLYEIVKAEEANSLQYLWGESYALVFVAAVPRAIWPNKPGGANMYWKLKVVDPWLANYNISHGVFGELIYNFGRLAVIPGMALFGLWAGCWWRLFKAHRRSDRMLVLYSMSVVPIAFMMRGTFNAMFGGLLYATLIAIVLLSVASARKHSLPDVS